MHIGQLIKQELEHQGRSVTWFAKQLSYSRSYVYKIFSKETIDTNLLMDISTRLGVDFFKMYSKEFKSNRNQG